MPVRAPRICPCGYRIASGERCPCERKRAAARNALADAGRPNARQRGYDTRWDKARAGYLRSHPTCVRCPAPATVVDHIKPHRGDQSLFWDKDNWQSLCKTCHNRAKQSEEKRGTSGDVLAQPFVRPSRIPVTIVCGPPGSGKSTYVEQHRRPGDLVIDLDLIKARLFNTTSHQAPRSAEATRQALLERNQILTGLAHDHLHEHVWFIVSAPEQAERDLWQRKLRNARVVMMDTPLEECLRRIRADVSREGQRDWMEDLVRQWFARARREKDLRNV